MEESRFEARRGDHGEGHIIIGVHGKGKESDEESRELDKSNDGLLWLDETIDSQNRM
jgi:hypothetical protein